MIVDSNELSVPCMKCQHLEKEAEELKRQQKKWELRFDRLLRMMEDKNKNTEILES